MRSLCISLALLSLLSTAAVAADDQAIKDRIEQFAAAWNKHDAKAMAAIWAEDGGLINPFGRIANGRAEVEQLFTEEHAQQFKKSTYKTSKMTVRSVTADVVVADLTATIAGVQGPEGAAAPDFPHHVALVFIKKDGTWMITAAHAYQFSAKPSGVGGLQGHQ